MSNLDILAKSIRIYIVAGLVFFMFFQEINVNAAKREIDINTIPHGYLFKVGNLKPGDWMPRDITILNEGIQDFKYMAVLGKKKSVKNLLEELDLVVKKGEDVLYEGKMNEFEGFTPRKLAKGSTETLFFQVTVPYDLGNSFQSSEAEVEILFVAEAIGEPGGGEPPGPPGEENPPGDENPSGEENTPKEENPSENTTPPSDEDPQKGNEAEEVSGEETNPVDSKNQIIVSPEMKEKLLPNTATNNYNILLIGGVLLGSGGILLLLYFRKFRQEH
ncbi:TasA family protein [Cytobacillus dafuensis]|uniref:LPXTG cell wall anchor domain-containing protein n=1 Tax=Cytobacillus dafuensis TaxID=1742359 RepID=A0A5B8Z5B7_CYTDA|nr:TasA family protein [Cytobacillus dafuensis]QED46789.1 LPXTG cell wall anchor domain-containing protein [Cytobacillus dafuensis]